MNKNFPVIILLLLILAGCKENKIVTNNPLHTAGGKDPIAYVDHNIVIAHSRWFFYTPQQCHLEWQNLVLQLMVVMVMKMDGKL
ncbi:hypothetical protein [Autumnicola musiva]|uniref:Uncharacterized protein n=1 Tax=Autumnicola musiva TaxID=3075589 RepID=A0ABU3D8P9_9FLAO|nr:hypothetical protein [Zunongwangia sp. F117]MDT0677889.1 hypothetical protein [Zunongwangia sp. F117]